MNNLLLGSNSKHDMLVNSSVGSRMKSRNSEHIMTMLFYAVLIFNQVTEAFCRSVRGLVGSVRSIDTLICYGLLLVCVVKALPKLIKRIRFADIVASILLLLAVYLSSLFSKRPDIQYSVMSNIIIKCFPVYIVAVSLRDFRDCYAHLQSIATIMLVSQIILLVVFPVASDSSDAHSQTVGYNIVLSCTIYISRIKKGQGNVIDYIGLLASIALMFMSGTRGPFLCIIVYLVISFLLYLKPLTLKKTAALISVIIVCALIYENLSFLLRLLSGIFSGLSIGYGDRLFSRLVSSSSISFDLGRDYITTASVKFIDQNWLIGCGLANDRVYISENAIVWGDAIGAYPHNIVLEFFMQYGVPIGIILCLVLLWIVYKEIIDNGDSITSELGLILFTIGVCPLFVSGSYLNWSLFYVFLGAFFAWKRMVRHERNYNRTM